MDDSKSLLVVICDVNPSWWANLDSTKDTYSSFQHCIDSLIVFCNSYLMMNHKNKLAFIACHSNECRFIYPKRNHVSVEDQDDHHGDGKFEFFIEFDESVTTELKELVEIDNLDKNAPSLLAGALTKAICYIQGCNKDVLGQEILSRILIMKGSPDVPSQYMSVMNCIFAAQKKNIAIDSCSLLNSSGFLQQASDITGGIYFNVEKLPGLLQYLLWTFLADIGFRDKLQLPSTEQIDYRAACCCHKQLVDIGFVCSVCLSIYCQFMPRCVTCQTKFKLPSLPVKGKKKKE